MTAAGVPLSRVPVYECPENTPDHGASAARFLLTHEPRPTALLVMSDQLAFGALDAARDLGLRVPQDLSIVGFDDVPMAEWIQPQLTTVHQPHVEKGWRAADLLLKSLRSDETHEPVQIILPTELVVRATTAPPDSG